MKRETFNRRVGVTEPIGKIYLFAMVLGFTFLGHRQRSQN
jgi:hypothetical protein